MQLFYSLDDWLAMRQSLADYNSIGFVPTMGNLHSGHLSLCMRSMRENDRTLVSIFVNPKQFNQPEDFLQYPRTLSADLELLARAGVDYCLLPAEDSLYADGFRFKLLETELCEIMEGKHRTGHFTGVLTIIMKLLNLVKPQCAYLGEKDYQQYLLIRDMVAAFFMNIQIKVCPTIREASGLAFSSRNSRLNKEQRQRAEKFARIFHQTNKSCGLIMEELVANDIVIDYLEEHFQRRFAAVFLGTIRLIDNYGLPKKLIGL